MRWAVFSGGAPVGNERAFRFGVVARAAASRAEWIAKARMAEKRGFAVLLVPDHFGEQIAPVPALLLAAAHPHPLPHWWFALFPLAEG